MAAEEEQDSVASFSLHIKGKVPKAEARDFYDNILQVVSSIGELSTSQEVSILFNLHAIGKTYRKGQFVFEYDGPTPELKKLTDDELIASLFKLGNDICARRRELGLSQSTVALDAGISQSYLSHIELARQSPGGLKRPVFGAVMGIARALSIDEHILLDQAGYDVTVLSEEKTKKL